MARSTPFEYWTHSLQVSYMVAEAQAVIGMRVLGMMGIWSVTSTEDSRMISEKVYAMTKATTDASKVALRGGTADQIAAAAIKPIRNKTRSNVCRLGKRGMKV